MAINPDLFISKGLLPENLPPVFTSRDIASVLRGLGTGYQVTSKTVGEQALHNASKRGGQRRLFKIPHPIFVWDQALFIEKYWPQIDQLLLRSKGTKSRPEFFDLGPRHVRLRSHSELPILKLKTLARFKYCLVADVARFFPSVYTHSLPWAINGKAAAKSDTNAQSATIFGNRLDLVLRQSQSKQTIGIAVGPDTSKVVAEILMSSVDADFQKRSGRCRPVYLRHVDDYFIGGHTFEECERHLTTLRAALRDHELDINESKTKIISTKYILSDDWSTSIEKDLRKSLSNNVQISNINNDDLLSILSKFVNQAIVSEDDGIIRHCIRIIDEQKAWNSEWDILEPFLAQCAVQFPHAIDYVVRVVAWRVRRGFPVDRELWTEIALTTIQNKASAGYDSETVWALWLLKELNQRLSASIASIVIENSNALVLALLAHFGRHRLIGGLKWKDALIAAVGNNPLAGAEWPLSLELHHLGYAPSGWLAGSASDAIAAIHRNGISIIDWGARPKVFGDYADGPIDAPDNALEDYSDDYGNFHDKEEEDEQEAGDDLLGGQF